MRATVLLVCAGVAYAVMSYALPAAAIDGQARTKLIREGKSDEIIRLREAELRQNPTRRAVSDLADEWVRSSSLGKAAEHYESREAKDAIDALILAEVCGRLGRLERVPQPPADAPEAVRIALNGVYFDYALFDRIDWALPPGDERIDDKLILYLDRTGRFDTAARLLENHLALGSEEERRRQAGIRYQVTWGMSDNPERLYLLLHQRAFKLDELHAKYRQTLASDKAHPAVYHEYVRTLALLKMKPEAETFGGRINEDTFEAVLTAIELRKAEGNYTEAIRLCNKALEMPITEEFLEGESKFHSVWFGPEEAERRIRADIKEQLARAYQANGELGKAKAIYTSFLDKEWPAKWTDGLRGLQAISQAEHDETFDLHALVEKLAASDDPIQTEARIAELYRALADVPRCMEHERRAIDLMIELGPESEQAVSTLRHVGDLASFLRWQNMEKERTGFLDDVLNRIRTWEPDGAKFNQALFDLHVETGEYRAAVEAFFGTIEDGKLSASSLRNGLRRGYEAAQKGDLVGEFFRRLEKVIAKYPNTPEYCRVWAQTYLDDFQPRRALEFYEKIGPELDPDDYREMARAYEIAKDFANAARCQERAVLGSSSSWSLLSDRLQLAGDYSRNGEKDKAVGAYGGIIEFAWSPDCLFDVADRVCAAALDGQLIGRLSAIVERKEATWKHHLVLAELCRARKENAEAIAHYRIACELNPTQPKALYHYAEFLDEQKMGRLAMPFYERCFSLPDCPDDVGPHLLDLYRDEQRFDDALALAERLFAEQPDQREETYQAYVALAEQQDELSRAKTFLEHLVHNYPNDGSPKRWLATIEAKLAS